MLGFLSSRERVNVLTAAARPGPRAGHRVGRADRSISPGQKTIPGGAPGRTWIPNWPTSPRGARERTRSGSGRTRRRLGNEMPRSMLQAMARQSRNACTPDVARELSRIWYETDVRGVLSSVQTPTPPPLPRRQRPECRRADSPHRRPHAERRGRASCPARRGPSRSNARSWTRSGASPASSVLLRRYDTILSTVLFTDIVDSTKKQADWVTTGGRNSSLPITATVREALQRWRGVENDTAGDGFYATFDGPARAIHCALRSPSASAISGSRCGPASTPASAR